MRRRLLPGLLLAALVTLAAVAVSSFSSAGHVRHHALTQRAESGSAAEHAEELLAPDDAILARGLTGADRGINPGRYFRAAVRQANAVGALTQDVDPEVADANWQLVGPTNIGGRVLDIVVDPRVDHPNTIFIAAATGGVWKSTNKGQDFTPAWPTNLTQTIGALAIAPDGTLYAGTGEAGPGGGSSTYGGNGVYRSRDDGQTWEYIGLASTSRIGRIVVDPRNPQRIYVAGTGPLYLHGGGRGLYVSDDGGDTWRRVLIGDNDTAGAVDVAIDPRDSKIVYAAMWDNFRERDKRTYEGLGSGLYKSTDGGTTWARIGTPFFGPHPQVGRIGVAVAPDGTVYGNVSGPSGVYDGFYTSTDGGQTWTTGQPPANPENSFFVYGWWFGRIYVDPKDSKHVYQGALVLQESKNGGQSWADAPGGCSNICAGGHADNHAMAYDPNSDPAHPRVYLGNDGGVFRSENNGLAWTKFRYLPISQINGLDVSQQDPRLIVAGLQDNGTIRNWTNQSNPTGLSFNDYGGGDGQRALIAPTRKQVVWNCSQYGICSVSTDGGGSSNSAGYATPESGSSPGTRWNYFAPLEFDPSDDHTIFGGSELVSVSHDDGATFTPLSPDLSNDVSRETNPLFRNYATVTAIGVAPGGDTVYAGTDDGNLWYSHDSTTPTSWTKATAPSLPHAWVTRITVDPSSTNGNVAYVTYSGYRMADNAPYVLKTTDGGVTWTDISANLPKAPVSDVKIVGSSLVAATDVGVFLRRAGESHWLRLGDTLPLAPAYELRYTPKTGELFVGTFGRGVYKTDATLIAG